MPGRGAKRNPKLIVVGEAPGIAEDEKNVAFSGPSSQALEELMKVAGIDSKSVYFEVGAVHCIPLKDPKTPRNPTPKEVDACIVHTYEMLDFFLRYNREAPPLIVALGNGALEALTGEKAIMKNRGIITSLKVRDAHKERYGHLEQAYRVMGTIHPSALTKQATHRPRIVDDLKIAWMEVTGNIPDYANAYRWLDNPDEVVAYIYSLLERYQTGEIENVALDFETTGLDMYDPNGQIVAIALCGEATKAVVIPWYHKDCPYWTDDFIKDRIKVALRKLLTKVPIVGWNFKFDYKWAYLKLGIDVATIQLDGLLARHWIYGSSLPNDLNTVAASELGFYGHGRRIHAQLNQLKDRPLNERHMGNVDAAVLIEYAGGDADSTYQLCNKLLADGRTQGWLESYTRLMADGIKPMAHMEMNGVLVDLNTTAYLDRLYPEEMEPLVQAVQNSEVGMATADALSKRLRPLAFSMGSGATLREMLYTQMGLPVVKKSQKTQAASTDKQTMLALREWCVNNQKKSELQVLDTILKWRLLAKRYSTYIKKMPRIVASDGYFHTTYNLSGTATGRHSSSEPSLHTIPKGTNIRFQFVPRWRKQGGVFIQADMSQAELRVAASLSQDENMIATIKGGVDMHTANAMKIFKIPQDKVTKQLRSVAKTISFAVLYGASPQRVAATAGIPVPEAEEAINSFFAAFPKIHEWMHNQFNFSKKNGCIVTPFGRVRWIENSKTAQWGDKAWRQCINTPIQAVASDITYLALLEVMKDLNDKGCKSKPFGFIHDAIVIDTAPGEWWTVLLSLQDKMVRWSNETHTFLKAPMTAEFEVCAGTWGFPCDLHWEGNYLTASGPKEFVDKLRREIAHCNAHILGDTTKTDDKGNQKTYLEFSLGVQQGTPDFATGKQLALN